MKSDFEPRLPILFLEWSMLKSKMSDLDNPKHAVEYDAVRRRRKKLTILIRRRLRALGYEQYLEIDSQMEALANSLKETFLALNWYILENSSAFANDLAKLGIFDLRVWQAEREARRMVEIESYRVESERLERLERGERARLRLGGT